MQHSESYRAPFTWLLGAALASIGSHAQASVFVVDRNDDILIATCGAAPNDCTLRGALSIAGAGDTIEFDAAVLAPAVISITSPLPPLNVGAVTIQGPLNDPPQVILDGSGALAGTDGLRLESDNNVLLGLWIRNFPGDGVVIEEAANNRLGQLCSPAGLLQQTGNGGWGIRIRGEAADSNQIGNQRIGTDGSSPLGNGAGGVLIEGGADSNQIGNTCNATVWVQANAGPGIALLDAGTSSNGILVASIGSLAMPNSGDGILIDGASDTSIGYVVRIVGNAGDGLRIESGNGNRFFGTQYGAIHDNGGIGINLVAPGDPPSGVTLNDPGDLDGGPNGLLNYPEIASLIGASGGNVMVSGSACAGCLVELFRSDGDPSGHGEGIQGLGQASADAGGLWSTVVPLPIGESISALATDAAQNVSEFSPAALNPVDLYIVDRTDDVLVSACTPAPNDCSLRGAMSIAGAGDIIEFDATVLAPAVISITSPLPPLNVGAVTIQGPLNDPPQVILDGSGALAGTDGLRLESDNNLLLGLWIRNFPGDGVVIEEAANNRLGQLCSPAGLLQQTGNGGWGIRIRGEAADSNQIGNQRIGTDGSSPLGNGAGGVLIEGGADSNQIGNTCNATVWVQANAGPGIALLDAGTSSNGILVANIGSLVLPNAGDGILIDGASDTSIGYVVRIVGNAGDGLRIESGNGNVFHGLGGFYAQISGNGGIGINLVAPGDPPSGVTLNDFGDADIGPNGLLNFPVIRQITPLGGGSYGLLGTACASCAIQLAESDNDPSGYGESLTGRGQGAADEFGVWITTVNLGVPAPSLHLTAAATRTGVGTSELALGFHVDSEVAAGRVCGNSVQETGEECEDGNSESNDGCSAACTIELCGDGLLHWGLGEQCDDGNLINGDGCTNACLAVSPAIILTPTSGLITSETGSSDAFTVVLATPPQAPVTLDFSSTDLGEGSVAPAQVVFDASTWNIPATITVTGVDDSIGDADQSYAVTTTVSSADPYYAALTVADVGVLNLDDDADLSIAMSSGVSAVFSGQTITWTIVVSNLGPSSATATVQDSFPAGVTGLTWTCAASGGASCSAAGSGDLLDLVSLQPGSTATYTATGTVTIQAPAQLTNIANIAIQAPASDPEPGNDSAQISVDVIGVPLFGDSFEAP